MNLKPGSSPLSVLLLASLVGCASGEGFEDSGTPFDTFSTAPTTQGNPEESGGAEMGDGDPSGDGDGDPSGDGDGDPTGDDDPSTTGDGDPTGDGDGDTCGDGQVSGTEACDGNNLDGQTCVSLGYDGGALACNDDCTLDVSGCSTTTCGNGVIDGSEACDGANLNGQTCVSQGYSGGNLACNPTCTGFNTAGCTQQACGNGVIENGETCDGAALNGQSCVSQGYAAGTLFCNAGCNGYDFSGCNDGNCCYANGGLGCEVLFVENCVCGLDSWCCQVEWDSQCASEALDCGAQC